MDQWKSWTYFPSTLYMLEKPEFLDSMTKIADEYLIKVKKEQPVNTIYPAYMSYGFHNDPRAAEFCGYVGRTARNILTDQGYDMESYLLYFRELWAQEHRKYSNQEEHVHGHHCQLSGLYFLNSFEGSPKFLIHDPRPVKRYANLLEHNVNNLTQASQVINFEPTAGTLVFFNSWLPHSFTRNTSDKAFKFIHFNIAVTQVEKPKVSNNPIII